MSTSERSVAWQERNYKVIRDVIRKTLATHEHSDDTTIIITLSKLDKHALLRMAIC
jgi:negative regulator of sigma E activity